MGYKTKKLSIGKNKFQNKGFLLYQNLWHLSKLTKKQRKWAAFKGKMFSIELARPVRKYKVLNTVAKNFTRNLTAKKNTFSNLMWKKRRFADKILSIIIKQNKYKKKGLVANKIEFDNKKA